MLEFSELVAFIATTDLARARRFYEGVLGLRVAREAAFVYSLRAGGTTLRLTLVERLEPAPYTVLGWVVRDIEDTLRTLLTHGLVCERVEGLEQDKLGIWRDLDGSQVAWIKDPDGNILSLTQR